MAGVGVFYVYMEFLQDRAGNVRIPEVRGLSGKEAERKLEGIGLVPIFRSEKCDLVVGTYPREGLLVRKGRKVEVYCIESVAKDIANRMVGSPLSYVSDTLRKLGMDYEVSRISFRGDERVLSAVYRDGKFYILVDSGKRKRFFRVGDYTGMKTREVEELLRKERISFRIEGSGETVVSQYPQPGSIGCEVVLITE